MVASKVLGLNQMPLPSQQPLTPSLKHELTLEEQGLWECRGPCRPLSGSEAQGNGQDVCEGHIPEHRNQGVRDTCLHRGPELHYQDSQMLPPPHCPLAMSGGTRSLLRTIRSSWWFDKAPYFTPRVTAFQWWVKWFYFY